MHAAFLKKSLVFFFCVQTWSLIWYEVQSKVPLTLFANAWICICENVSLDKVAEVDGHEWGRWLTSGHWQQWGLTDLQENGLSVEWNRNTRKRHTKEHTDLLLNKQYGATINREKAHTDMFARPNVIDRRTSVQQSTRFKSNQKWLFSFRQWSNIPWHIPSHVNWVLYDCGGELRGLW